MNARILSNQDRRWSQKSFAAASIPELTLGGITPFTTIDFPGRLAAVLYTQGCAWRCRYCHNSHLWPFQSSSTIPFKKVIQFLENRHGLLDGVVFCGGEPTAHEKLPEAMRFIQEMGFQVALHTTGMYPERLRKTLSFCDWVGMDVKAPFRLYEKTTQKEQSGIEPRTSVGIVLESGVDYEFRTTVHHALLSEEDILEIARDLSAMGVSNFVLQSFQPKGCLDETLKSGPIPKNLISQDLENKLASLFSNFRIRR
jgi:pyruvate formate lyase activating enzyme